MTYHKSLFYSLYFYYMICVSNIKEHFEDFWGKIYPATRKFDLILWFDRWIFDYHFYIVIWVSSSILFTLLFHLNSLLCVCVLLLCLFLTLYYVV